MRLDDLDEIWGVKISNAQEYGTLRRDISFVMCLIFVILIVYVIDTMQSSVVSFGDYAITMLLFIGLFLFVHKWILRASLYRVYKFYRRFRKSEVKCKTIKLSPAKMHDILYKTHKGRLKEDDTVEHYVKVAYEACGQDLSYAYSLLKNLLNAKDSEFDTETWELYYVEKGLFAGVVSLKRRDTEINSD